MTYLSCLVAAPLCWWALSYVPILAEDPVGRLMVTLFALIVLSLVIGTINGEPMAKGTLCVLALLVTLAGILSFVLSPMGAVILCIIGGLSLYLLDISRHLDGGAF